MENLVRNKIITDLGNRHWFAKTKKQLRGEILSLPGDCDGFLWDLAKRPEEVGNIRTLRMVKLLKGEYILTPIFEVESLQTKQKYTYEYASWKYGSAPGKCRGIIFLEDAGEIKYFTVRRSDRFSLSRTIYDAIGAIYSSFGQTSMLEISKKIGQDLVKVLQIRELEYRRIIDLGLMYPNSAMSNEVTNLFAAIVDVTGKCDKVVREIKSQVFDVDKIRSEIDVFPIGDLVGFVNKTDDSFLLSTISRVLSRGIVPGI